MNPNGTTNQARTRRAGRGQEVAQMEANQDALAQRAAIYASTPDHGMASIRNQLDLAQSCAEQNDLLVVGEYVDLRGERGQFLQMMADAMADKPRSGRCWCPN